MGNEKKVLKSVSSFFLEMKRMTMMMPVVSVERLEIESLLPL
jgi:hypothetical protein